MNVIKAIQDYIERMLNSVSGMKAFVLDKETTGMVSVVFSQSQILQKEVYLFERLDITGREPLLHLKAVCFLRPTKENIESLCHELRDPKYGEYHLFFSHVLGNEYLNVLAQADEHCVVQQVQEFFGDYFAVNRDTFSLSIPSCVPLSQEELSSIHERICLGLSSVFLSLKKTPIIRYQRNSEQATKIAHDLERLIDRESALFDFKRDSSPILLILDRKDDPVTPLLTQWTYQAMVHELIGILNNRVDLKHVPGVKSELQEIVLSSEQDSWYSSRMYSNFGDLGISLKELVDEYQSKTKSTQTITTISEMKKFVENYPEFRKLSGNVSKHVTLIGELSRLVEYRSLLDVSELEQQIAGQHDHSGHLQSLKEYLQKPQIQNRDKLRLAMLYALRYETTSSNEINNIKELLKVSGIPQKDISIIDTVLQYGGSKVRINDIFGNRNMLEIFKNAAKRGLKGVTNIYTDHKPLLKELIENLISGRLKDSDYPYVQSSALSLNRGQEIVVFIYGGATYEEALTVYQINTATPNFRVLLGGTNIINSTMFLDELDKNSRKSYKR